MTLKRAIDSQPTHLQEDLSCTVEQVNNPRGEVLDGRYRLEKRLGAGAYTVLYQASDLLTQRTCVVKLLNEERSQILDVRMRFEEEARRLCDLRHPNLVQGWTLGCTREGRPFLVRELLHGMTLSAMLRNRRGFLWPEPLPLMSQVLSVCEYLQSQGVLHPSLHPDHIFLHQPAGGIAAAPLQLSTCVVKLLDVLPAITQGQRGLSQREAEAQVQAGRSPEYLPPELLLSARERIDARALQWASAALLHRLLTGRSPRLQTIRRPTFLGAGTLQVPRLRSLGVEVPPAVDASVHRALSMRPDERFRYLKELSAILLAGYTPSAPIADGTSPSALVRLQQPALRDREGDRATEKFASDTLLALCRNTSEFSDGVPQALNESNSTRKYSDSVPRRLMAQARNTTGSTATSEPAGPRPSQSADGASPETQAASSAELILPAVATEPFARWGPPLPFALLILFALTCGFFMAQLSRLLQ